MPTRKPSSPSGDTDPAMQATPSASDFPAEPDREERIRRAAYAVAERRGFTPGAELEDWLQAEAEVDGKPTLPAQDAP